MASVDERVVAMSFENAKFEQALAQTITSLQKLSTSVQNIGKTQGFSDIEKAASKVSLQAPMSALDKLRQRLGFIGSTKGFTDVESASEKVTLSGPMSALDKLKARLGFIGDTKGFSDVEKEADKVDFKGMSSALDGVTHKFSVLRGAAAVALGNIATKVSTTAASMAKSLSLGPVIDGLHEYETNLNSIQTILANTQASGANLNDVNKALNNLNRYSDKTIYNFSEMARNIGTFTAAGVDLKTSTESIKGIANLAALSGSNSQQASTAMYQLSQAISAGRVSLQDWNSVVNAGMGGTVFQRALAQTAARMGTLKDGAVKLVGPMKNVSINGESFRNSITAKPGEQSWLTSKVLTNTLKQFTGDLSDAQLKAMGFNDQQIKSIQQTAKTAVHAATEVKTLGQVFDVAKETIGSGWAQTFQTIFGNFTESKKTFTDLSNTINGFINTNSNARNKVLADWKALGGRKDLIEGIKNVFEALSSILKPIHDAFRQVFPPSTGKDLAELTKKFREFTEGLKIGPDTANNLKRTFAGFFAVLHIGLTILGDVIHLFGTLLGAAGKGSGGILNFTGSIGDFLVSVDNALTKGGALKTFFGALASVLKVPIQLLGAISSAIFGLFSGDHSGNAEKFGKSMGDMGDKLKPVKAIIEGVVTAWHHLTDALSNLSKHVPDWLNDVADKLSHFGDTVADAFKHADYDKVFDVIQTSLIGGIFLTIKKALGGGGKGIDVDFGGGVLKQLSATFGALTGNLKAMQKEIQAKTLLEIAGAIGILAAGVLALSQIDPKALTRAMTAVAVGMAQLVGALALLSKFAKGASFLTMPLIATSLIGLATAVTILAAAVKIFSTMSWEGMTKGLIGVGGALAAVGLGVKTIGPRVGLAAAALIPLAIGMNLLAIAVKQLAGLSWNELAKGLVGVGGALALMGVGLKLVGPSIAIVGPGLIAASFGLTLLAGAVNAFGSMSLKKIATGVLGVAGSLEAIGLAIDSIPPTVALQAAGLVILGVALTGIAGAIGLMGKLKIETLVKGIASLGAVLLVLAVGLEAMSGTLLGAAALLATAAALAVLAPTLAIMGNLKWETIIKGLVAIGASMGVIAVVGALTAPALAALGAALIPLGLGMAAVAASVYLLASGLAKLGADGAKGISVMIVAITAFVTVLPKLIISFLSGLVDIIGQMAKLAPQVVDSLTKILNSVIQVVINTTPKLAQAIGVLLDQFISVALKYTPRIIHAGFQLLLDFLQGLHNNIGKVTNQTLEILIKFLDTMASRAKQLAKSGINFLLNFLSGINSQMGRIVTAGVTTVVKFLNAMTGQVPKVILAAANMVAKVAATIIGALGKVVTAGLQAGIKFLEGVAKATPKIITAAVKVASTFVKHVALGLLDLTGAAFDAIITFLRGFAAQIRSHGPELIQEGFDIAEAIVEGIVRGLYAGVKSVVKAAGHLVSKIPGKIMHVLHIGSPSKVMIEIGGHIADGLAIGISNGENAVVGSIENTSNRIIRTAQDTLGKVPDILDGMMDMDPTITPVLDLSQVKKDASQISDMTNVTPITAASSYKEASTISTDQQAAQEAAAQGDNVVPMVNLTQNNYSPEALSDVTIYRQTRNQLAQVKSALGFTQ